MPLASSLRASPSPGRALTWICLGSMLACTYDNAQETAELYDPATGTWSTTGRMRSVPLQHTATLLPSGEVLLAGDTVLSEPKDAYDPTLGTWNPAPRLNIHRRNHLAVLLNTGQPLVVGGDDANYHAYASAELLGTPLPAPPAPPQPSTPRASDPSWVWRLGRYVPGGVLRRLDCRLGALTAQTPNGAVTDPLETAP